MFSRLRYRIWQFKRSLFRSTGVFFSRLRLIVILLMLLALIDVGRYFFHPDVSALKKSAQVKTAFMKHSENRWEKKGGNRKITRRWVPLSRISRYAIAATVISEDDKFWQHSGFDLQSLEKALREDIKYRKLKYGGSTISQQLVKNLYLSPSKNPLRKLKEAILAWRIEKTLSKRRILEIYLNVIEWGDGIYGIEAASRVYYNKSSSTLTPDEACMLASVIPSPRRYNPLKPGRYLKKHSARICSIMQKRGIIRQ